MLGAVEAQRFEVRFAARGDEEMRTLDDGGLAVLVEVNGDALHRPLDALDAGVRVEHDFVSWSFLTRTRDSFGILVGKQARGVEHGDVRAEHAMRLAELKPDRPAAEHDEVLDAFAHVEDCLVGEIGHLVEAGNRRDRAASSPWR